MTKHNSQQERVAPALSHVSEGWREAVTQKFNGDADEAPIEIGMPTIILVENCPTPMSAETFGLLTAFATAEDEPADLSSSD